MAKGTILEAGILKPDASPLALRKKSFGQYDNTKGAVFLIEPFVFGLEGGD
jgi:hypothetical protein